MESQNEKYFSLGNGIKLRKATDFVEVWRNNGFLFRTAIDPREQSPELRQLVVDLIEKYQAQKTKTAECFSLSRQTIDNWIDSFNKHGIMGLINSSKSGGGRPRGNKAREHETTRSAQKQEQYENQLSVFDIQPPVSQEIEPFEEPFYETTQRENNRYAGQIVYQILLSSKWNWYKLINGYYGVDYKIFQIFLLMVGKNIGSIEQLKNVHQDEGGTILGLRRIPSLPLVWSWFYTAAERGISQQMCASLRNSQLRNGQVGTNFWFTDGHALPYSGKERLHKVYNTKRRLVEPGRTNLVTCDIQGRIVDYQIQEGQGDLRARILMVHQNVGSQLPEHPVQVFDREGHGNDFYYGLVTAGCPFVSWEKHADQKKLAGFSESQFTEELTYNDTLYRFIETEKELETEIVHQEQVIQKSFKLRRFYVCNTKTGKRTSVLANNATLELSQQDCVMAILARWGASENTFKYLNKRHPLHYQPGFTYSESKNQLIENPEIKKIDKEIAKHTKELQGQYKELSKKEKQINKDGSLRKNDVYTQYKAQITEEEVKVQELKEQKKQLPEKIDISGLQDYESFKGIDNEAKTMFDFVTTAVWNARKEGIDILRKYYSNENDIVDLFYTITHSHGTVQITPQKVIVTLEPLQQHSRRAAQIDFCRYLTALAGQTPNRKHIIVQVARS